MKPNHHKAILIYQQKLQQIQVLKRLLEQDEEEALTDLIKQLDEDERTQGPKGGLGETLRELFYSGRERTKLCVSRDSIERDCGTP